MKNELEISKSFCIKLGDGNKLTHENIFKVLLGGDKSKNEVQEEEIEMEKPW